MGKLFLGLIQFAVGLVGVTFLFFVGLLYDRAPAGWPNYEVKGPLGIHLTLHAPGAGAVTVATALAAANAVQLKQAQANETVLKHAITGQNVAIEAQSAAGARALAQAEAVVQRSRAALAVASGRRAVIAAPIVGDDMCARVKAFDGTFVGALKP